MTGRRRHERFAVATCDAVFNVLSEVAVHQQPAGELVVFDSEPRAVGEIASLDALVNGVPISARVRVAACRPCIRDGNLLHELIVHVDDPRLWQQQNQPVDALPGLPDIRLGLATLTAHVPIQLLNCSADGCLFEAPAPISVGKVGSISASLGGKTVTDAIQVTRCEPVFGSFAMYYVGASILSVTPAHAGTLRYMMRCEVGELAGAVELRSPVQDPYNHARWIGVSSLDVPKTENVLRFEPSRKSLFPSH